ncbi:tRNA adenosine(34) deaminase TadA [Granulicella sp. S190]|uniref:tRNA adenosine(34) deaminase TadA n=1 Tax=Granulicella sp. S190 TaxID=1747226 RepID=UPI00131C24E7|nr:tRNA adenosine(34) deaminase TadA [Granulicella sp. S190]
MPPFTETSETDESFLREAIAEARNAEANGEVPVGAIVVHNGSIIARGQNRVLRDSDPTAHAEIVALRQAGLAFKNYRLEGCILYATLEPCAMCAGAILHARISRLVYAAPDPKAGACGSVLSVINHPQLNHKVKVTPNLLAEECGTLLTDFFRRRRLEKSQARILQSEATSPHVAKETTVTTKKTARKWSAKVDTDSTHPDEGLFSKSASAIAKALASKKVSPKGPASGMRMLNFYINRAGKNLPQERHAELEKAKALLSEIIAKQKPEPKKSAKKTAAKKSTKKAAKKTAKKASKKTASKKSTKK